MVQAEARAAKSRGPPGGAAFDPMERKSSAVATQPMLRTRSQRGRRLAGGTAGIGGDSWSAFGGGRALICNRVRARLEIGNDFIMARGFREGHGSLERRLAEGLRLPDVGSGRLVFHASGNHARQYIMRRVRTGLRRRSRRAGDRVAGTRTGMYNGFQAKELSCDLPLSSCQSSQLAAFCHASAGGTLRSVRDGGAVEYGWAGQNRGP